MNEQIRPRAAKPRFRLQRERGDGTTTRQIISAPRGAIYVWHNSMIDYPMALARRLGRTDLLVVGPSFGGRWLAGRPEPVVLDHATDIAALRARDNHAHDAQVSIR